MELTDAQWDAIKGCFAGKELKAAGKKGGRAWRSAREVLDGVLWILRTGAPWADLPARYPPYQTCHRRFQHWIKIGVMTRVLTHLRKDLCERGGIEDIEGFIDGTYIPAKRGARVSANAARAMQPRSWLSQTAMVFHSLSLLQRDPDTTVFSPTLRQAQGSRTKDRAW